MFQELNSDPVQLSAITAGGSQAVFFKINTWGEEAPCLIAVLNTNQKTPFDSIEDEKRIVEICDSLSIGAAIENHYTVDLTDRFDQSIRIKLHNNGNRENFHFFHWKSTGNF